MQFTSIRIITADVARLVGFYEAATACPARWYTEDFAEVATGSRGNAVIAIASTRTLAQFAPEATRPGENSSVIIEFLVEDVDAVHASLADSDSDSDPDRGDASRSGSGSTSRPGSASGYGRAGSGGYELVKEPTTMPWGNRSLLVRDPDGNLVNFFAPVTPEAKARFAH